MPQDNFPWTGGEAPTFGEIREKPATYPVANATATVVGGVLQGVHVPGAAGANPTAAEFLALLTALQNAGVLAAS